MRVIYVADDGTEFDDEFKCEHYEWLLNHPQLKDVRCYDKHDNEFEDIMSELTYFHSKKIIVPTDEAAKDMQELADYTGYCYYAQITKSGTWIFDEKKESFVLTRGDDHEFGFKESL